MAVIEMSVVDWIALRDNPRQRDTVMRAKVAHGKHLATIHPIHRYVFAASSGGNLICKLDGHTRAYLWDAGLLEFPPDGKVEVLTIEVKSLREAAKVYDQIDSAKALKRPHDMIYGAAKENKFRLTSSLLRNCKFSNQLRMAESIYRGAASNSKEDINILVKRWKQELLDVDALGLSKSCNLLIAFALVASRKYGEKAHEFMATLDRDEGTKTSQGSDGVQILATHLALRRAEKRTAGWENLRDICDRATTAFLAWNTGRRLKSLRITSSVEIFKEGAAT